MQLLQTKISAAATLAALLTLAVGCSGGGNTPGFGTAGGDFFAVRTSPTSGAEARLNDPVTIDFTQRLDIGSADLNAVQFQVFDLAGNPLQEQVTGTFRLGTATGDSTPGRRLVFEPTFPTNNTYTNGGFRPARRYTVTLSAGSGTTVLSDQRGRGLENPLSFAFRTPETTQISQLFRDPVFGGPRVVSVEVTPRDALDRVLLSEFGSTQVEVEVDFDQPLDPATTNLPILTSADPVVRATQGRGRIFLQYDDPELGTDEWIPATVDLERNRNDGATVVLRPVGLLPSNARIEVVVLNQLRDLAGQSNVGNPLFQSTVSEFETVPQFEPQFDALVEDFSTGEFVDQDAVFLEPRALVQGGRIRSTFAFEGNETIRTYRPTNQEVFLNTSFAQITPEGAPPFNVFGGEFRFRRVEIPLGVTVTGTGPNPMVWLVNGEFIVNGTLTVDGGDGQRVDSLQSPNIATAGGVGAAGGGSGGQGSPITNDRSLFGEAGFGSFQTPAGGGAGGQIGCEGAFSTGGFGPFRPCGSGGGGGSFSFRGDPFYPPVGTQWDEVFGEGGGNVSGDCGFTGINSRDGGPAGPTPFTDNRLDNNFFGTGVNIAAGIRIQGELLAPRAGTGGGGGGDRSSPGGSGPCNDGNPNTFINDMKGGGGGGGAGALIIMALDKITIGATGRITANGGDGGGGEQAGGNEAGGGGGGGSGGMIVLVSGVGIDIFRNSGYSSPVGASSRFDFPVSADGGICLQGEFAPPIIAGKYFNNTTGTATWGNREVGGFGGLGLIQMMTPPGSDTDGTGNRLDDRINFFSPMSTPQNPIPVDKVPLLGWRGWPISDASVAPADRIGVDDNGNQIMRGRMDGAIRPSPILLPATFGAVSRARSKWIDLGSAARRQVASAPSGLDPRVVVSDPADAPSPDFRFAGTMPQPMNEDDTGYADFVVQGVTANVNFPIEEVVDVTSVEQGIVFEGRAAFAVNLPSGSLGGALENEYSNYRLQLRDGSGATQGDFRILAHTEDRVICAVQGLFPTAPIASAAVLAKFFEVMTDGQPTLGGTVPIALGSATRVPRANVRIGFAFTTDPSDPMAPRWPDPMAGSLDSFEFDVDLSTNAGLRTFLETNRPQFVQWDVLFNRQFGPSPGLSGDLPFPELDYLVLPFRY